MNLMNDPLFRVLLGLNISLAVTLVVLLLI